jgi:hypothetical protein
VVDFKNDYRERERERIGVMGWIDLAQDRDQWRGLLLMRCGGEMIMSSTSAALRCSSREVIWWNFVLSSLMPAKANCESSWANRSAGRSAQNGGSRTATRDTSVGWKVFVGAISCRGHQCSGSF